MPSQDVRLLLYSVIDSRGDLVSASFKQVYKFLIKIDGVKIYNLIRRVLELNSQEKELTLTVLCRIRKML